MSKWCEIAQFYDRERDEISLPSILVDDVLVSLADVRRGRALEIFDFGTGSGTLSRRLAVRGHKLLAYDPNVEMREVFRKKTSREAFPNIVLVDDLGKIPSGKMFDVVLCSNVFDHLVDVPETLNLFRQLLESDGRLVLSIPHPMKSTGRWEKEGETDNWRYLYYRIENYFLEGPAKRVREDKNGNVIIRDVVQNHRTISTYFNWIREAGFNVDRMYEPCAGEDARLKAPALHTQSSRIPFFWVLDCAIDAERKEP